MADKRTPKSTPPPIARADLDRLLERATGCAVFWDSMKLLLVDNPKADTVARIERFLRGVRQAWQTAAH